MSRYRGSNVKARDRLFVWVFIAGALAALANSGITRSLAAEEPLPAVREAVPAEAEEEASVDAVEEQGEAEVPDEAIPNESESIEMPSARVESEEEASDGAAEEVKTVEVAMPAKAEDVTDDGRIKSISFQKDWGVRDALQFLGASFRKNIVPSSKVDGALTITALYNVTFEDALEAILGHGFKYVEEGNFIKVYTAEEYKKILENEERMVYRVFTLHYISAAEAKKLITPVLSAKARTEATSAAVVDFPTGESISTVTGGGDTTALNDTLIVYDYPEKIDEAEKVLIMVDVMPRQVLIEATILSVNLTEDMQFGVDWQTLAGTLPAITSPGLSDISRGTSDLFRSQGTSQVSKSGGLTVGFAHDNIAGFIRAVEEVTDVTVLANPKILAVNKQLGQVYIGKKLGYKNQTTQTETSTTESVDFLDTGTKLSFRPYIGTDGYIRMDIHPKDSSGELNSQNVPDETSAELVTNIVVRDGQTVVIGGLFRDKLSTKRTQVPVLGDLPFVGGAFRGRADTIERQEVVVLLTPHIIYEPSQTNGEERAEDVSRKRHGAKEKMQWLGRTKITEEFYADAARYYVEGDKMLAMKKLAVALHIHPAHLDSLRLKERMLEEASPKERKTLERIILRDIEREEAPKWRRR